MLSFGATGVGSLVTIFATFGIRPRVDGFFLGLEGKGFLFALGVVFEYSYYCACCEAGFFSLGKLTLRCACLCERGYTLPCLKALVQYPAVFPSSK